MVENIPKPPFGCVGGRQLLISQRAIQIGKIEGRLESEESKGVGAGEG